MSYENTCSEDYKVAAHDSGETVTFTAVRGASSTSYTVTFADGHDLTAREIGGADGFYRLGDRRWSLGREQITSTANYPQPGDRIVDASSVAWRVLDAVLDDLRVSFVCTCRQER